MIVLEEASVYGSGLGKGGVVPSDKGNAKNRGPDEG